jgi:hypothetical protein
MNKSYLYVGVYYDIYEGRDVGIKDKKIGRTIHPNDRENKLNATKGPIGYMFIKLYQFIGRNTANEIEKIFETLLEDRNTHGEWYKDDDEFIVDSVNSVINNLKNMGFPIIEIDLGLEPNLSKVEKEQIQRAKYRKLSLHYKGKDVSGKFAVDTFIKAYEIVAENVGWDTILKNGEYGIFNNIEDFYVGFPSLKTYEINKITHKKVNDYILMTHLSNIQKYHKINKLIEDFKIDNFVCTID